MCACYCPMPQNRVVMPRQRTLPNLHALLWSGLPFVPGIRLPRGLKLSYACFDQLIGFANYATEPSNLRSVDPQQCALPTMTDVASSHKENAPRRSEAHPVTVLALIQEGASRQPRG